MCGISRVHSIYAGRLIMGDAAGGWFLSFESVYPEQQLNIQFFFLAVIIVRTRLTNRDYNNKSKKV